MRRVLAVLLVLVAVGNAYGKLFRWSLSMRNPRDPACRVMDYEVVLEAVGDGVRAHLEHERESGQRFWIWEVSAEGKIYSWLVGGAGAKLNTEKDVNLRWIDVLAQEDVFGVSLRGGLSYQWDFVRKAVSYTHLTLPTTERV